MFLYPGECLTSLLTTRPLEHSENKSWVEQFPRIYCCFLRKHTEPLHSNHLSCLCYFEDNVWKPLYIPLLGKMIWDLKEEAIHSTGLCRLSRNCFVQWSAPTYLLTKAIGLESFPFIARRVVPFPYRPGEAKSTLGSGHSWRTQTVPRSIAAAHGSQGNPAYPPSTWRHWDVWP